MNYTNITREWFDNLSDQEAERFLVCMNDGQNDHIVITYQDILKDTDDGSYDPTMFRSQIIEGFMKCFSANSLDTIYFSPHQEKYFKVKWWWQE